MPVLPFVCLYVYEFVLFLSFTRAYFMIGLLGTKLACKQTKSWINNIITIYLVLKKIIKTYGEWNIDPRILNLSNKWRWLVSFMLRQLHPRGKRSWYPLDTLLGGPQGLSGGCEDDKNLLFLSLIKPRFLGRPAPSQGHEYWIFTMQKWTNKCKRTMVPGSIPGATRFSEK
jgi:hypothetical protein